MIEATEPDGATAHLPTQRNVRVVNAPSIPPSTASATSSSASSAVKHFRRVATRFDKLARNFLAAVLLARRASLAQALPVHDLSELALRGRRSVSEWPCPSLRPRLLLMDEPFASVDAFTRLKLQAELHAWPTRPTVLFLTDDVSEAILLGDRIIVMSVRRRASGRSSRSRPATATRRVRPRPQDDP